MKPLRFAQISDLHLTKVTYNPFKLLSKRLIGTLNWLFSRRKIFSQSQVFALPALFESLNVDQILICGDLTTTALESEYQLAKAFVNQLSAPWLAIPGNHDHYTQIAYSQKHFYRYFANDKEIKDKTGFFNLKEHGVEAHRQDSSNWWIVLLDTARATWSNSARGLFSEKLEKNLREILSFIPVDHSIILVNHYPFFQHERPRHNLSGGEELESIVASDQRIKAYLHGHTHHHQIADLQAKGLPVIIDSGCCADKIEGSWNLLTVDDEGIQIDAYFWTGEWKMNRTETYRWIR